VHDGKNWTFCSVDLSNKTDLMTVQTIHSFFLSYYLPSFLTFLQQNAKFKSQKFKSVALRFSIFPLNFFGLNSETIKTFFHHYIFSYFSKLFSSTQTMQYPAIFNCVLASSVYAVQVGLIIKFT
jgi:hypothetical protein